jgi:hypothetical protein
MPKELQPRTDVPTWDSMSPGEKLSRLLDMALDVKKNILSAPLPDPNDDSADAHRMRSLILAAAESTIEQTIRLRTNQLAATNSHDDEIGKIFEERQRRAIKEIERLSEGAAVAVTAAKSRH